MMMMMMFIIIESSDRIKISGYQSNGFTPLSHREWTRFDRRAAAQWLTAHLE